MTIYDNLELFEHFVHWLYDHPALTRIQTHTLKSLIKLYIFAHKYDVPAFKESVFEMMERWLDRRCECSAWPFPTDVMKIYTIFSVGDPGRKEVALWYAQRMGWRPRFRDWSEIIAAEVPDFREDVEAWVDAGVALKGWPRVD